MAAGAIWWPAAPAAPDQVFGEQAATAAPARASSTVYSRTCWLSVHDIFLSKVALFGTVSRVNPYIINTMSTPQHVSIRLSEIASDPSRLVREMKAGNTVNIVERGGVNYTVAPTLRGEFTVIGTGGVAEDIQQFLAKLHPSGLLRVEDIRQSIRQFIAESFESFDEAEAEDMVSLPSRRTGVANTVFVSSGNPRHAPRIKIAVDPPNSFNPRGKNVSMQMQGNYDVVGEKLPPRRVIDQAKRWIKQNYAVLMQHWDNEISGDEVVKRVKPLPRKKPRPAASKKRRK